MGSRLFERDGMLLWSEPSSAESHRIVAARGDRQAVIVPDLAAPPDALVAVGGRVIWRDPAGVHVLADGEVMDLPDEIDVRCLAASATAAYTSRPAGEQSVIGEVGGGVIAKVPGQIDRLLAIGDHLAWTCAGGHEVFAQPIAGGAPSIVYGATEALAMCGDGDHHLVIT